jgi:hypothetical protein
MVVTFLGGSKIGKHLQLCGRAHYLPSRKHLGSRTQLDEPDECASSGEPFLLYKILHLHFFPLFRILCALGHEIRKKIVNLVLMAYATHSTLNTGCFQLFHDSGR